MGLLWVEHFFRDTARSCAIWNRDTHNLHTTYLHGGRDASVGQLTTYSDVFISRINSSCNSFSHKFKSLISSIG